MKRSISLKVCMFGLLSLSSLVCSSEKVIMQLMRTKSQFDYYVTQYQDAVVYCYALPEHNQKKEQKIKRIYKFLQDNMIKNEAQYTASHIKFIAVNRSVGDLVVLQKEYGFKNNDSYLMFFKQGKAVAMKILPEDISAQKINALIAARHLEKQETEQPELKNYTEEREGFELEDSSCSSCPQSGRDTQYCSNKLCTFCRYKKPLSYYDQPDFVTGYGSALGHGGSYGNYWGGTMTNPIN